MYLQLVFLRKGQYNTKGVQIAQVLYVFVYVPNPLEKSLLASQLFCDSPSDICSFIRAIFNKRKLEIINVMCIALYILGFQVNSSFDSWKLETPPWKPLKYALAKFGQKSHQNVTFSYRRHISPVMIENDVRPSSGDQ